MPDPPIITFMTDFGDGSPYIAQMKGVALSIHPQVRLVDVTHSIPPQDIRTGALTWPAVIERFPAGTIHVAVIDPGVGSPRDILYARYAGQHLICPDNGLVTMLARSAKHALQDLRKLTEREFWLDEVSATFHGRDIMTPAAAHLASGVQPAQLGPVLDQPVLLEMPEVRVQAKQVSGCIATVDSFGNLITGIHRTVLEPAAGQADLTVRCGQHEVTGVAYTYQHAAAGSLVALYGSSGWLELAIVNGNAARTLNLAPGAEVTVTWF